MKAVTRYETADGQSFETEDEAEAHEAELEDASRVETWLDETLTTAANARERSRRHNIVIAFLAWERAADEGDYVAEIPEREAAVVA